MARKKKLTDLFTTLIIRTYSEKFTPENTPSSISRKRPETAPGRVEIPTSLLYKGSRYTVIYRLEEPEGWRITDIVAEGVSLIANYRTHFDAEFKKGGADACNQRSQPSRRRNQMKIRSLFLLVCLGLSGSLYTSCSTAAKKTRNRGSQRNERRQVRQGHRR